MRGLPVLLAAALLSSLVVYLGLQPDQPLSGSHSVQANGPCGLAQPAFCDTFTTPYTGGGRTGNLDPTRWSVARMSAAVSPPGVLDRWFPSHLPMCDQNVGPVLPDNDLKFCHESDGSTYFDEQYTDSGTFTIYSFRPRQPFDFAGRTGTVVFDADAKTAGSHSYWLELWITDQPVPAPGGALASSMRSMALSGSDRSLT